MRKTALMVIVLGLAACGGGDDDSGEDVAPQPAEADDAADPNDDGDGDGDGDGGEPAPSDGEDGGDGGDDSAGGGGEIADPQPAGQAFVSVDGQEFTLTEPGAVDCTITDEAITFGFRIGDNEVTLGAGANLYDTGWLGDIRLTVANVAGQEAPSVYYPDLTTNGELLVIDGTSAEYSGPMKWQPPNDGSNPPAIDIGDGVISVTCS